MLVGTSFQLILSIEFVCVVCAVQEAEEAEKEDITADTIHKTINKVAA